MYDPTENDLDLTHLNQLESLKNIDKGHNRIYRYITKSDGSLKRSKIDLYTSGGCNTHIRDAESGKYYSDLVGSANEDLYFKTTLSTGECNKHGYNTLFYLSPEHCAAHLKTDISQYDVAGWLEKKQSRLSKLKCKNV